MSMVLALLAHDTPAGDIAMYFGYVALGVVVPGTLIWRACSPVRGGLAVDLSGGTAVGCAAEVLAYIAARAGNEPRWFLAWPLATMITFTVTPRLRRHWRVAPGAWRMPAGPAWSLTGLVAVVVIWAATILYQWHGLRWPGNANPYVDMPFHLSLVGELKHHVPPMVPQVLGEPLSYHWFVYAEMAATSWATGIEPETLLFRLSMLPMGTAFVVLIAALGKRVTGSWW
ncbi:hypothetical protein ETD86_49400, partial [Nonomuraea turkmeniaca]